MAHIRPHLLGFNRTRKDFGWNLSIWCLRIWFECCGSIIHGHCGQSVAKCSELQNGYRKHPRTAVKTNLVPFQSWPGLAPLQHVFIVSQICIYQRFVMSALIVWVCVKTGRLVQTYAFWRPRVVLWIWEVVAKFWSVVAICWNLLTKTGIVLASFCQKSLWFWPIVDKHWYSSWPSVDEHTGEII